MATLRGGQCYYPHVTDGETEVQRGEVSCPGHTAKIPALQSDSGV